MQSERDLGLHVGELLLDQLIGGERLAELLAVEHVLPRAVPAEHDPERTANPKGILARPGPLCGWRTSRQRVHRRRFARWRHRRVPRGAALAAALDQQREAIAFGLRAHPNRVAIVNGLLKPAVGRAAFQERAAPARDRQVRHGGEYGNARHQRAPKSEAVRHGVVVNLVFGRRRAIEGANLVSGGQWRCHGSLSTILGPQWQQPVERI